MVSSFRTRSRRLALISLLLSGALVILIGLLVLALGLAITHNDTFHETIGLKEQIETRVDYVQYWIGIPYIITGVSVACSAVNLRRVSLTVCTIFLSLVCVVLSLAGLVVEGPDWVLWKDLQATQRYWEGQDGFACTSSGDACVCNGGQGQGGVQKNITTYTDCETLLTLSALYGTTIGCFIVTLTILLASVTIIVYNVTSKREKARREGKPYQNATTTLYEAKQPEPMLEAPVGMTEPVQSMVRGAHNQGYDYPAVQAIPKREQPVKPVSYRQHKSRAVDDSVSQQNITGSSIGEQSGVVMMDPGRFRLGDDDIY